MKKFLWSAVTFFIVVLIIALAFRYLGDQFGYLLGAIGLGGAGVLARARKEARKKHEKAHKKGPDTIADDNLDMLKRRHSGGTEK